MTISLSGTVAAPILPGVETTPGDPGSTGLGGLFAGLLGSGQASSDVLPESAAVPEPAAPSVPDMLSAAQIMAAAQVVPVTPVLAAALSLQGRLGTAPVAESAPQVALPTTATPTTTLPTTTLPTGSTAVSAGDPVLPAVPSSAVPLAAPAATELPDTPAQTVPPAVAPETGADRQPASPATATPGSTEHPVLTPTTQQGGPQDQPGGTGASPQHGARPDHGGTVRQPETARAEPVGAATGPQASTPNVAAAPVAGRADAPAPTTAQVTSQVFPEIGRLVSRGDGTQRITLTLNPEALGEVRVVLSVRDGDVHVRMVGSEAAQQALRAGAPELHRLLDLAGASSSQIVVGDQGASSDAGQHSGPSADRSAERETQDHRTAGTRDGDTSARDGSDGGQHSRSSTDPTATRGGATRTHPGVDVTM